MPEPSGANDGAGGETWTWDAKLGVYFHAGSRTYALPGSEGEAWRYLSAEEMAAQRATASTADGADGRDDGKEDGERSQGGQGSEGGMEEGEIEDDVGWGALMDPEKEKAARLAAQPQPHPQAWPGHDRYADGTPIDGDPLLSHEPEEVDPAAHLLRLVVKRSQVLEIGSVAVIDARAEGTQLGRDRGPEPRLRIKEMEVSKTHSLIFYSPGSSFNSPRHRSPRRSPERYASPRRPSPSRSSSPSKPAGRSKDSGWFITDLGSTLGTYVAHPGEPDAHRLSAPKHASSPYALQHGDRLTVGRTTFAVHLHADWPCAQCQMSGNPQISLSSSPKPANDGEAELFELDTFAATGNGTRKGRQAMKRRREMDALRGNLLGPEELPRKVGEGYVDRSAQRRRLHPPSPPRVQHREEEARPVMSAAPTGPSEAARKLLAKQGWSEGQGLGRTQGRAEPVVAVVRGERVGLGARGQVADQPGEKGDWRQRGKQRRWDEVSK